MSDDLMDPELIDTGGELFRQTDAEFEYWYAVDEGINASFDIRAYSGMGPDEARQRAEELQDIADFVERVNLDA